MRRAALFAFAIAFVIVHGAWQVPITGAHVEHVTFSQLVGYALERWPLVHVIATPLVGLALVLGLFTIAARRLPNNAWSDVIAITALAACAWIATPDAALVWSQRPNVWIYGAAAALWVAAPYRCHWQPRAIHVPLIFVGALCAGSSTRQIAVPLVALVGYAIHRMARPRPRWAWIGLAGLVLGTVATFIAVPMLDLAAFVEGSGKLVVLTMSLQKGAQLFALLLALVLVAVVHAHLRPKAAVLAFAPDDAVETTRWIWVWCGLALLAVFDPGFSHATLFPAALILAIAAYPYLGWLTSRWR